MKKKSCNVTLVTYTSNFLFRHNAEVISDSCRHNINVICCLQNTTISIAKVEEAYKCECQSKGVIEEAIQFLSFDELLDGTDATEDVDENRLLPAMNKLWPYLVICLRNKISVVGFFTSGFPSLELISRICQPFSSVFLSQQISQQYFLP